MCKHSNSELFPSQRLCELFSEADSILENHPELVEEIDQEQFERIEKLVEDVETDDLPARLRALADEINKISPILSKYAPYKGDGLISNPEAVTVNMLNIAANRIAAELEKEEI